jgi:hypothetical protein
MIFVCHFLGEQGWWGEWDFKPQSCSVQVKKKKSAFDLSSDNSETQHFQHMTRAVLID